MNVMRIFAILLWVGASAAPVLTQPRVESVLMQAKNQLKQATDQWDEDGLIRARSLFERLLMQEKYRDLIHYYIGLADYRLASRYFLKGDDKAEQFLDDGIKHLQEAINRNKKMAEAHALLSTLYGQKIGLEPSLAMTLGQQSWVEMDLALRLAPENPRVRMLKAISTYFAPEQYGGSKEQGKKMLRETLSLFEKEAPSDSLQPDWGHEEALMMLATWHLEVNDTTAALKLIEKTLRINPEYAWAKGLRDSLRHSVKR